MVDLQPSIDRFTGEVSLAWYDFRKSEHLFLDADRVLPAAGLITLPILGLALQQSYAGKIDLRKRIAIRLRDRVPGQGILSSLQRGLHLTVRDLLVFMTAHDDHTAANRIIDLLGIDAINAFCRAAGLERTTLAGPLVGTVVGTQPEAPERSSQASRQGDAHETSAADMLGFLMQLERGDLLPPEETALAKEILGAQNHPPVSIGRYLPIDPLAHEQPLRIAAKSGRHAGTRHDAALVYDAAGSPRSALVVMTVGSADRAQHVEQEGALLIAEIARSLCIGPTPQL